jgi:polar amino acid transport system substrate-binding protein
VDIVNEALEERLQIPVTFEWQPWQRAQYSVKQGERDAMITVATPARLDYAAAGEVPVAVSTVGLFTTSDHSRLKQMEQIRSTDDLRGYRILTYLGDGWALDNLDGLDVDSDGNDLQTVLRKLAWGRGDLFPQTVEVTGHYIEELGYDDAIVQLPGVNLGQIEFRLMISQESGFVDRLADIDAVLSEMWQDGTMERLLKPYQYN